MKQLLLTIVLLHLVSLGLAAPPSGHTNWGGWSFDWIAGAQSAGLSLRNVYYQNEQVLYKANMPVIRVRYKNDGCGPYADLLSEYTLQRISDCGDTLVCQRSFRSGDRQWLELGILAKLGEYRMYQVYYFSDDGYLQPHFFSKGLQCQVDHDHHPYWRFDFDVKDASSDQLFVYDNNRSNRGWGTGWIIYETEFNDLRKPSTNRAWFARDNSSGHGVWILPGGGDGAPDSFSTKDAAGRVYSYTEDEAWPFGAWGHLGYSNSQNLQETDVIFWYISHMFHAASEGPSTWHSVGPWLKVYR